MHLHEVSKLNGVYFLSVCYNLKAFYRLLIVFLQILIFVDLVESFTPCDFSQGLDCILSHH